MSGLMVYEWRPECRIALDAQRVGLQLEAIKEKNGGMLTPEAVVTHARAATSALHAYFEWDDSVAAAKHRLEQSRYLIRHLVVREVETPQLAHKPIRAFVHVEKRDADGREKSGYLGVREALSDHEIRAQLLRRALSELKTWQTRYTEMQELARVFDAIGQAELELGIR